MRAVVVALLASALAGCAPLTPPPPFHFMETAEVLPKGQVAVTAAVGGGGGPFDAEAVGGGARVRVGLGGGHEIGVEGTGAFVDNQPIDADHPEKWFGDSAAWGYKLSWKYSPLPWFAVEAGVGGSVSATGLGVGGDVALLFSRSRGFFRPYVATRGTVGVPVDRPIDDAGGGITPALVQAAGFALVPRDRVRVYAELGLTIAGSEGVAELNGAPSWVTHYDAYGAIGLELRFGHRR